MGELGGDICTALSPHVFIQIVPCLLIFLGVEQEIVLWEAASLFSVLGDLRASHMDGISAPNSTALSGGVAGAQASCGRKRVY